MRARALSALLLLTAACSCDEDPGVPDSGDPTNPLPPEIKTLRIDPPSATIRIDGITPGTQRFTVFGQKDDGSEEDVTDKVALSLTNTALGTLTGATFFTGGIGGTTELVATAGSLSARATITVVVERVIVGPGVPMMPGEVFVDAPEDPSRAPVLLYPNDGVLLPANLGAIEVHYRRGSNDNELFEITFAGPSATLVAYVRCETLGNGCVYKPAGPLWALIGDSNKGGPPIKVKVRGTDDQGSGVGASAEIEMSISAAPVQGGLYYWTTSNGTGIMRVDFGQEATPERFFPFQGGGCWGCHALSRNGRHMTLSQNGQRDGRIALIDVAARQVLVGVNDDRREQFQSWNPEGDKFAGVWADDDNNVDTNIRIRDGRTSEVLETIPIGYEPDHPDWSPRGDRIVFTRVTHHQTTQRPGRGGISYVQAESGGGWSAPIELLAPMDGINQYYPAFAPDGQFIIYDRSTCNNGSTYGGECDADADDSALLHAIKAEGGTPVPLAKANAPGVADEGETELCNTYPKWAPFVDARNRDGSGRIMWFTFSSRRAYGLREPNGGDTWIWMAAIDPDEVLAGRDGSFAAFALPFQDLGTSNHIAQWTTTIVPPAPSDGGLDPGSEGGVCLGLGDVCSPAADTCCAGTTCSQNGPGIYLCRPNI
jgi:hypothetical protein